jgi:cytochrome c oxidase cbb3-type subunit 2
MLKSHKTIEKSLPIMAVLTVLVMAAGTIIEIFPLFKEEVAIEDVEGMRPYSPLELAGFLIYKREGCVGCHSQQIRVLRDEVERYGHYSLAAEGKYDYPFMWGSKRTGPDLARIGEKYSDDWHVEHLIAPRSLVPESIMPNYKFLAETTLDTSKIARYIEIYQQLGVPYEDTDAQNVERDIRIQLGLINEETDATAVEAFKKKYPDILIRKYHKNTTQITELDALVAYLQGLGRKVDLQTNQGRNW